MDSIPSDFVILQTALHDYGSAVFYAFAGNPINSENLPNEIFSITAKMVELDLCRLDKAMVIVYNRVGSSGFYGGAVF